MSDFEKYIKDQIKNEQDEKIYHFLNNIIKSKESIYSVFKDLDTPEKRDIFWNYVIQNKIDDVEDILFLADDISYGEDE